MIISVATESKTVIKNYINLKDVLCTFIKRDKMLTNTEALSRLLRSHPDAQSVLVWLSLGTKPQKTNSWHVCDPPLNPNLHPSWDFLQIVSYWCGCVYIFGTFSSHLSCEVPFGSLADALSLSFSVSGQCATTGCKSVTALCCWWTLLSHSSQRKRSLSQHQTTHSTVKVWLMFIAENNVVW